MDNSKVNEVMLKAIIKVKGIVNACSVSEGDRQVILDIEKDAES
jgi:hypothetical protein